MRRISVVLVAALLVQIGYVPCVAQEAVILKGEEIDRTKLKAGAYVEVTYTSEKGKEKTARGYTMAVEDDAFVIRPWRKSGRGTRIKYKDIITLMTGGTERDMLHLRVVPGARVRVKAPSVSKGRFVGRIMKVDADTLLVSKREAVPLAIPLASVKELEVSRGKRSRVGAGAFTGLLFGAGIGARIGYETWSYSGVFDFGQGFHTLYGGILGGIGGLFVGAVVGAGIRTDKWEEVPLDGIRVSLSPQCHSGVMLSASFAF